jgi:hypothetical protein
VTDVDLLEHKAGPAPDEPPYHRTCLRDGLPWPCPARKAELQEETAEVFRSVRAQVSDDARRIGVLALVELGVSVWSSTRVDAFDQPLGGVVVHIEDVVDRETGEISRWFTCLDPTGSERFPINVRRLAEAEVLPSGVEATTGSRLTGLIKRLGGEVHNTEGSFLTLAAAERVRWMHILTGVVTLAA